jgi:hypothetical protein
MTRSRLVLISALAATLLLAGCSSPATPSAAPDDPGVVVPTEEPQIASLAELAFPFDSPEWLDALAAAKADVIAWHDAFSNDCTAELAGSSDSADCTEGMLTGLQKINGVKTQFDFSPFDVSGWEDPANTGLAAIAGTRAGIQTASDSGSDFIDTCYYVPGQDGCVGTAQTFLDGADAAIAEMATWQR